MLEFLKKLFGGCKAEEPKRRKPIRWGDGLSAEKNILQTITRRTGCTLDEARNVMRSTKWKFVKRPGDGEKYYDQRTRTAIIAYVTKRLGKWNG